MSIQDIHILDNNGVEIAWREAGQGEPILLIHGFASSGFINWISTGWVKLLVEAGYRTIVMDNRGHGQSSKLYDPECYYPEKMAQDAAALLNHLDIKKAHVMGYSMGARISTKLAVLYPHLVGTLNIGGMGMGMVTGTGDWETVANALNADSIEEVSDTRGLMFRKFAEHSRSDLKALASCVETSKEELTVDEIKQIQCPTIVIVGTEDEIAGDPAELANLIVRGEAVSIADRNHMLTVGDKIYKEETLNFLTRNKLSS